MSVDLGHGFQLRDRCPKHHFLALLEVQRFAIHQLPWAFADKLFAC